VLAGALFDLDGTLVDTLAICSLHENARPERGS
jgi:beta-phosphoglucomutase-like phosphatase (HAD superfamily)